MRNVKHMWKVRMKEMWKLRIAEDYKTYDTDK